MMTSTLSGDRRAEPRDRHGPPAVDVVVPVFNEERVLDANISRLHHYLRDNFPLPWRITIADNASTDETWRLAQLLAGRYPNVRATRLEQKGRGRALRAVWSESDAQVLAYMDVDLSTDLGAFLPLVAPLLSGHSDVAIGSRLTRGARVVRGAKREIISRSYNALLRLVLHTRFRDAQCGFKAARASVAKALLPAVADNTWFFDTEFLVLAERHGLRIAELPVDWTDDPDSRVHIMRTVLDDLRGVFRLALTFWLHRSPTKVGQLSRPPAPASMGTELVRCARIGAFCTAFFAAGFLCLQPSLGPYWASGISLTATMTWQALAHPRRGAHEPERRAHPRAKSVGAHLAGLAVTTAALYLLGLCSPDPDLAAQTAVATVTSTIAGGLRFVLLPGLILRSESPADGTTP